MRHLDPRILPLPLIALIALPAVGCDADPDDTLADRAGHIERAVEAMRAEATEHTYEMGDATGLEARSEEVDAHGKEMKAQIVQIEAAVNDLDHCDASVNTAPTYLPQIQEDLSEVEDVQAAYADHDPNAEAARAYASEMKRALADLSVHADRLSRHGADIDCEGPYAGQSFYESRSDHVAEVNPW